MSVKVLHISTTDSGGAGLAAMRIHNALKKQGVESTMLVADKHSYEDTIVIAQTSNLNKYVPPKSIICRKIQKILRRRGRFLSRLELYQRKITTLQHNYPAFFTSPISNYDLAEHPLVQDADIIHLHWIQNFLDFETFFKKVQKPILWTFHDLNPMYGGFHHSRIRTKYYNEYQDVEDDFYNIKREAILANDNVSIVAISSQMKETISKHEFYSKKRIYSVFNCVDAEMFPLIDQGIARQALGITDKKLVFVFANRFLNDSEKGLPELSDALQQLELNNCLLICVGDGVPPTINGVEILHFAAVNDTQWLAIVFSAADFMVMPSHQEAFAQTPLESMSCGTPVIITPVSGASDLINDTNGIICKDTTSNAIADGITLALTRNYNREKIRQDIVDVFSPQKIAQDYIHVYEDILKRYPK